jgi:hypothetical protein
MLDLLMNRDRREQLAAAGYQRAWESFRVSAVVDRYLTLYAALRAGAPLPVAEVSVGASA